MGSGLFRSAGRIWKTKEQIVSNGYLRMQNLDRFGAGFAWVAMNDVAMSIVSVSLCAAGKMNDKGWWNDEFVDA